MVPAGSVRVPRGLLMTSIRSIDAAEALSGGVTLRPIRPEDDPAVARVIRTVMPEFGAVGGGFSITDPEVDAMSTAYARPDAVYYVLDAPEGIVGGAGIGPLPEAPPEVCELEKMYLLREARGHGYGRALLRRCLDAARRLRYRSCYLETLHTMNAARALYESMGFVPISAPVGATGHTGCDRWYLLDLKSSPPADPPTVREDA